MLNKLRKRFVISNMIPVALVIILSFCFLTFVTYYYERSQSVSALSAALEGNVNQTFFPGGEIAKELPTGENKRPDEEISIERLASVSLIAIVDANGEISLSEKSFSSDLSDSDASIVIKTALSKSSSTGIIPDYNLRYLKVATPSGYKIAFSDRTSELQTVAFLLRMFALSFALIFILMFAISEYMAKKAIAPVEKSWNEQNRFVADASHELKTPLTVILANMDIIDSNKQSTVEEQSKWIENTKSEAKRMTELVNDMLFLARSDAGVEQSYNFQKANLSNLCDNCALTFESVAFEKNITLNTEIAPNIEATIDEAKIKQVIMILLDNAMKYVGDKGTVKLSLSSAGKQYKISVENTGLPIPKEKQEHLFERFFRADDSRVREKGGYGLGLSIAQNIIVAHGGKIELTKSDDESTIFSVYLNNK